MTSQVAAAAAPAPSAGAKAPTAAPKVQAPTSAPKTAPTAPAAEAKPVAPDFKSTRHKVKLDGQEAEVDYDELVRGYQKAQVSDRRYQEAARMQQEAGVIKAALEKGDYKTLAAVVGPQKARSMAEEYLIEQMQYDNLPEHEKKYLTERQKREALEAQVKQQQDSAAQARYQAQADKAFADLDAEVGEALRAVGKKPNPRLALRIVEQIEARLKAKEERLPAAKAWEHARQGLKEDIALIAPELTVEEVHELFGKEFIDRLMKHKVDQVLDSKQNRRTRDPAAVKAQQGSDKPLTIDEKFKQMEKSFKRK